MKPLYTYGLIFLVSFTILVGGVTAYPFTFDEPAYVNAARNFIAGTPSVNPEHPPFAKYLIALSIQVFGDNRFGWRFPSLISGALVALSAFGLSFRLTRSWHVSYIGWFLVMANGFWYVMGRVGMLPIIELAFESAGVWAFAVAMEEERLPWFALSGAMFGLSAGCRWCGLIGFAVCIAYVLIYCRPLLKSAATMAGTACFVYVASWIPLLVREHRNFGYLLTANKFIFEFHRHFKNDPRLGQMWWTWIFRLRPQPSLLYLLGNPVVGALGLAAIVLLFRQKKPLLPLLYLAHLIQWAIGIKPMTFYYYYFEAFMWLTVALAVAMKDITIGRARLDIPVAGCAAATFVYWYTQYAM